MLRDEFFDPIDELSLLETVLADFSPLGKDTLQFFHFYFLEVYRRVVVRFWVFKFADLTIFFTQFCTDFVNWLVETEWIDNILK